MKTINLIFSPLCKLFPLRAFAALAALLISVCAHAGESYSSFNVSVEGEGHDIVLIPGLMSDGRVWEETSKALSSKNRVHTVNISGFGRTPAKGGNSLRSVEKQLTQYIATLDRPTVVGHSIGGFLAMSIAINAPDSLSGVVSVDGLPFIGPIFTRNPNTKVSDISAQAKYIKGHYAKLSKKQLASEVARGIYIQATSPSDQNLVIEMSSLSHGKTVGKMMHAVMTTDLRPQLSSIKAKMLMLGASGAMPNEVGKDQVESLYSQQFETLPSAQVKMNRDARHFIMLDDLDWLLQNITNVVGE